MRTTFGKCGVTTEQRLRTVWVREDMVLDYFAHMTGRVRDGSYTVVPEWVGLPDDVRLEFSVHDPMRKAIGFVVSHPSFPEVEPGERIPSWPMQDVMQCEAVIVLGGPTG
jgi:hypothetical protein